MRFGRGDQDHEQHPEVPDDDFEKTVLRALAGMAAAQARTDERLEEFIRISGIRLDRADPAGRLPDVRDELAAEENITARINWAMTPAGRAEALVGAGMDGFAVAGQLQRERGGIYPLVMTNDGSTAGQKAAAEVDAAARAARDAVRHGAPLPVSDGTSPPMDVTG